MNKRREVIWGASHLGENYYKTAIKENIDIVFFVDQVVPKSGFFNGIPVVKSTEFLKKIETHTEFDAIVFAMWSNPGVIIQKLEEKKYKGEITIYRGNDLDSDALRIQQNRWRSLITSAHESGFDQISITNMLRSLDADKFQQFSGEKLSPGAMRQLYSFSIKIRYTGKKVIGFFWPKRAYLDYAGNLPQELAKRGYSVIFLTGEEMPEWGGYSCEKIYAGSGLIHYFDWLDIMFTPTVVDCIPKPVKTFLLPHTLLGGIGWIKPGMENNTEGPLSTENDKNASVFNKYTDFTKLWLLNDYIAVTTEKLYWRLRGLLSFYGKEPISHAINEPSKKTQTIPHLDNTNANNALHKICNDAIELKRSLCDQARDIQTLVKIQSYLPLDSLRNAVKKNEPATNCLIYAPTLTTAYDKRITSLRNYGSEIISLLLDKFPNHTVIFRPHPHEESDIVNALCAKFTPSDRFELSHGRSYIEDYVRSTFMVTDISTTAYTFSLGTFKPVIFFSPAEDLITEYGDINGDFLSLRSSVGIIVKDIAELAESLHSNDLFDGPLPTNVRNFCESLMPNEVCASKMLADSVDAIFSGKRLDIMEDFQ